MIRLEATTLADFAPLTSRTVCEPGEVDEEIHALCEAVIAPEGRLDP